MEYPAGYLITFTTYGERLHGDHRGSVERIRHLGAPRELEPDPDRLAHETRWLRGPRQGLDYGRRAIIADAIAGVCEVKGWGLYAVNVRTNHVHVVVRAEETPEKVMNLFKIWASRRVREANLLEPDQKLWTRHGSTRYLRDEQDVVDAVSYVLEGQGKDLGGTRSRPIEE